MYFRKFMLDSVVHKDCTNSVCFPFQDFGNLGLALVSYNGSFTPLQSSQLSPVFLRQLRFLLRHESGLIKTMSTLQPICEFQVSVLES